MIERHPLLGAQVERGAEAVEEVAEREDLAGAAVARRGHGGQRPAVEHRRHRERRPRRARRRGPRRSSRAGRARSRAPRAPAAARRRTRRSTADAGPPGGALGGQRDRRAVAGGGRDAVDERARVLGEPRLDERGEARVAAVHDLERLRARARRARPSHATRRTASSVRSARVATRISRPRGGPARGRARA